MEKLIEEAEQTLVAEESCYGGSAWIWHYFGQCTRASHQVAGFCFGISSIVIWMTAHIVLLSLRHRQHALPPFPKKGLSFIQLGFKTIADVFQCTGALLTWQFGTQIAMGLYLLLANVIFYIQWAVLHVVQTFFCPCTNDPYLRLLLCSAKKKKKKRRSTTSMIVLPLVISTAGAFVSTLAMPAYTDRNSNPFLTSSRGTTRLLLEITKEWDGRYCTGFWIGCISCVMQVLDTLPQIYSVILENPFNGLHITYLVLAVIGDALYLCSVYLQEISMALFIHSLPWTLPRTVVIGVHMGILIQMYWNRKSKRTYSLLKAEVEGLLW